MVAMKKRIASIVMICVSLFFFILNVAQANDFVSVTVADAQYHDHQPYYEVWYDVQKKNPAVVVWDLSIEEAIESDAASGRRSSSFKKCGSSAKTETYAKSGYDRGHMCPNNDRDFDEVAAYNTFKMCNVCPQTPKLNRGSWKKIESYCHKLAAKYGLITIVCGPLYDTSKEIETLSGGVVVPSGFFKMVVANDEVVEAWIFSQDNSYRTAEFSEIMKLLPLGVSIKIQ